MNNTHMKKLIDIFEQDLTLKCDKWLPYFDVYETYFSKYRGQQLTFVEVGVQGGGSMQMWRKYFGPAANIYGIDISPDILNLPLNEAVLKVGDQEDLAFWDNALKDIGEIDCFVDDGGHTMLQQINTLIKVWPMIKEGGVFICEDTHTSYYSDWGNGYCRSWTMMEFSKKIVDLVNLYHIQQHNEDSKIPNDILNIFRDVGSIHYYDSMIVFVKGKSPWVRRIVNG